jgi:penicillin-binding protein 1C
LTISAIAATTLFADLPSPKKLTTQDIPVSTQIFDRHGTLLYEIYQDIHRTPLTLDQIPDQVKHATIAIEDQSFYTHFGFSVQGIARAVKNTLFKDKLQGGSTITQQLVKTSLLTPERTLKRKIREAVLTIGTEILYTKDEILEMYLNNIPYGGTAYGIEAASNRYFGKSAQDLSVAEAALLAGLPQAPSRYSPFSNPDSAKARQQEVLRRMTEDGYLDQASATHAFETPLIYNTPSTDIKAPHFVFYVKQLLEEKYGLTTVEQGGLRVTTTLDLSLQEYAQASVSAEIADLEKYQVSNGAALITNPGTGEILAMVGSRNYFDTQNDGQVNVTLRLRQPGSSIKPINYVTALQTKRLTASSVILDYPTCFKVGVLAPYCPKNYTGGFHGSVSFRQALANSYNIPAVKVLAINSLESMIATASAMGISTFTQPERYGLSLTLGGGEVTMLDMSTAFGTLANSGVKVSPVAILNVTDYQGNVLEEYDPQTTLESLALFLDPDNPDSNTLNYTNHQLTRVLNREPAFIINHILADNNARAAAFGTNSKLRIPDKTVSVKTGTTNDLRDNWTVGYTSDRVVVVWVGNNDNTPMNRNVVSGVTGAAPIFNVS